MELRFEYRRFGSKVHALHFASGYGALACIRPPSLPKTTRKASFNTKKSYQDNEDLRGQEYQDKKSTFV